MKPSDVELADLRRRGRRHRSREWRCPGRCSPNRKFRRRTADVHNDDVDCHEYDDEEYEYDDPQTSTTLEEEDAEEPPELREDHEVREFIQKVMAKAAERSAAAEAEDQEAEQFAEQAADDVVIAGGKSITPEEYARIFAGDAEQKRKKDEEAAKKKDEQEALRKANFSLWQPPPTPLGHAVQVMLEKIADDDADGDRLDQCCRITLCYFPTQQEQSNAIQAILDYARQRPFNPPLDANEIIQAITDTQRRMELATAACNAGMVMPSRLLAGKPEPPNADSRPHSGSENRHVIGSQKPPENKDRSGPSN